MHMLKGDPHPSIMPRFRGTRDPERSVTRSWSGRKKKRVKFEDDQPQSIPNPTQENFSRMCITQLLDDVSHIYYTGKELTNRDSMRVHDTFTMVIKVWKEISTILPALTERWWPTTHTFLFSCAEIGVTPLDFTMMTSLSIGRYPTQVLYDDARSVLSNARQLLPNINSSHIKSGNVSISHLRTYLTVTDDRDDDITIARAFIHFMMGYLWFQTVNDTVPLGYLTAVANLDSAAQYDWGSAILASLYHSLDIAITTGGAITGFVQLLTEMRQTEFLDCDQFVVGEERETYASNWAEQTSEVGHMLTDSQRMGNIDLFGPTALRAGQREMLLIARLRDQPPMSSSYGAEELWYPTHGMRRLVLAESARDAQRLQELTDELAIAHRQIDSIDHQLYAHDLQLRRGRDVRVVQLSPGGGARMRQHRSGPRTRGGGTSHRGQGTGDDYE
ncbi:hypothetical protein GIB67_033571 [Kingdonia uniflora]|uniref:Aminotransferase-like plant mobile domain-containing protein n=1 Tax=Kingdonia uniflora TaxID=39325 RepID=A0A7J7L6C7_9MAGN|nr:hypothetical protein GIB67_033571 [Kingdonia uniflora]